MFPLAESERKAKQLGNVNNMKKKIKEKIKRDKIEK